MQLCGYFDQCWCQSNALSKGARGMVVLFKTEAQLVAMAKDVWVGSFVWSLAIPLAAGLWFALLARKARAGQVD